jgi:hypothetical protein
MSLGIGIINPKKRREIEGVSSSSLIDLKATLFTAEESVSRMLSYFCKSLRVSLKLSTRLTFSPSFQAKRAKAEGLPSSRGKVNFASHTAINASFPCIVFRTMHMALKLPTNFCCIVSLSAQCQGGSTRCAE